MRASKSSTTIKNHKNNSIFSSAMRISIADGFFYSLMVGVGETYLPAFVISQNMPEYIAGLFSTVPVLTGASLQLFLPQILHRISSIKKWVVGVVLLQAFSFLPFIYFNFHPGVAHWLIFLFAAVYWFAGFAATPGWNLWMTEIVPEKSAAHFFSIRQGVVQFGILVGMLVGGVLLESRILKEEVFWILFLCAFFSRVGSGIFLLFQPPKKSHPGKYHFSDLLKIWKQPSYKKFLKFIFAFFVMISISSPFVTPYLLGQLKMSYELYMYAIGSLLLAKVLTMPFAAQLIEKYGEKKIFLWGALGMSPLPALWNLSENFYFILSLQAISGMFWGFFEVALSVIFFNQIQENKKMLVITAYSFFNSVAIVLGSFVGAAVLKNWNHSFQSYHFIFVLGACLRVVAVVFFIQRTRGELHLLREKSLSV